MTPLFFDEDFHHAVIRGIRRKRPDLVTLRVQETPLSGAEDPDVLELAAKRGFLVVTHDANTMTQHAKERVAIGQSMPGLVIISQSLPIGQVIDDLILIADALLDKEWEGQIHYLPI